jgi:hypothetical protein
MTQEPRDVYLNPVQQRIFMAGARDVRVLAARRFGKTDGVLGPRMWAVAESMPQGAGGFLGASRKQLYSRTVPGVIAALERFYGFKEGTHFGWGRPPRDVPKCIIRPKSYDNCLWFANGHIYHALSLAVFGSANGMTLCEIFGDECKFMPKKKIDEEVMPSLSGIVHPLGHAGFSEQNPYYESTCFVSDASLSSRGNWLAKEEDRLDDVITYGEFEGKTYRELQAELDHYADRVQYFNELLRSAKRCGIQPVEVSAQTKAEIDALWEAVSRREGPYKVVPPNIKDPAKIAEWLVNYRLIDTETAELLRAKNFLLTHEDLMEMMAIRGSKKYQSHINALRCNSFYFVRASSLDNIDILGEDYIRRMKRDLPPLTFARSVLNLDLKKSGEGFYCNFDPDIHCYIDDGCPAVEDSIKVKRGKVLAGGTAYPTEYESPDFDLLGNTKDCTLDGDLDPKLDLEIALDYNNLINWIVVGQIYKREGRDTLNIINSMFVKNGLMIQDLIRDFDNYYAPHKAHNPKINYYYSHTAKFRLHGISMDDIKDTVTKELSKRGWIVRQIDEGQAPKHEQKYQTINSALSGLEYPAIRFNRLNNESLIGAIENCDVTIGYNGFRKDKSGEKISIDAEDATPEELRTDGTDAFDELYWGVRHFRNNLGFLTMPNGTT